MRRPDWLSVIAVGSLVGAALMLVALAYLLVDSGASGEQWALVITGVLVGHLLSDMRSLRERVKRLGERK